MNLGRSSMKQETSQNLAVFFSPSFYKLSVTSSLFVITFDILPLPKYHEELLAYYNLIV
jgi:hypothetical protein